MAVSNAVGSNVFDILVCLGLPWFLSTVIVSPGIPVKVHSKGKCSKFWNDYCPCFRKWVLDMREWFLRMQAWHKRRIKQFQWQALVRLRLLHCLLYKKKLFGYNLFSQVLHSTWAKVYFFYFCLRIVTDTDGTVPVDCACNEYLFQLLLQAAPKYMKYVVNRLLGLRVGSSNAMTGFGFSAGVVKMSFSLFQASSTQPSPSSPPLLFSFLPLITMDGSWTRGTGLSSCCGTSSSLSSPLSTNSTSLDRGTSPSVPANIKSNPTPNLKSTYQYLFTFSSQERKKQKDLRNSISLKSNLRKLIILKKQRIQHGSS